MLLTSKSISYITLKVVYVVFLFFQLFWALFVTEH